MAADWQYWTSIVYVVCSLPSPCNFHDISHIEEGRAESKSPHSKIWLFSFLSQQAVSADIILNSADGIFSPKTEETKS
jgi:hypothetical protein